MKEKNYIELVDFNDCEISDRNGFYGGNAGVKEGIIYNGEYWIIKYPKNITGLRNVDMSYSTSPLSEYVGSQIYNILGYDVHETLLGERNDKIVVACKDFCYGDTRLAEMRTLKNIYNNELQKVLDETFSSTSSSHKIDLEEILAHLKYNPVLSKVENINERFWDMVIIDILIANNDRNNGNWGLLFKNNKYELAPIFDNGSSFNNRSSNEKLVNLMSNDKMFVGIVSNVSTTFSINGHELTSKKILNFENDYLNKAIIKNVPLIKANFPKIKELILNIPESYNGKEVFSKERKTFYLRSMEIRLEKLLEPKLEQILNKEKNLSIHDRIKKTTEIKKTQKQTKNISKSKKEIVK